MNTHTRRNATIVMGLCAGVLCGTAVLKGFAAETNAPDSGATGRFVLRFDPSPDAVESLGWHQLRTQYAQKGDQPIVIEAEASTRVRQLIRTAPPGSDADASGGLYIKDVCELENDLLIETPGDYQAWYRAFFPVKGTWEHWETIDDGPRLHNVDSNQGADLQWLWVKGPVHRLSKGPHRYVFPSPTGWWGGARLDKIVLMPAMQPEPTGMGPDASLCIKQAKTPSACLVSNRLALGDLVSWGLEYEKQEQGGTVTVEYSHDRGKHWLAWEDGKTRKVKNDNERVMFRVRLSSGSPGAFPQFRNMTLVGERKKAQ